MLTNWTKYERQQRNGKDYDFEDINRQMDSATLMYMKGSAYSSNLRKLADAGHLSLINHMMGDIHFYDPSFELMMRDNDFFPNGNIIKKTQFDGINRSIIELRKLKKSKRQFGCGD